ncbi:MAG: photosystem II cytochrome PsbV2 [Oscillatoria princeps RMCB-10]|jgi:photosystem II cytochrome c550|nr:photosystem II cytochrome PsbV2 [Oscillatoria princeps RMCB-10]
MLRRLFSVRGLLTVLAALLAVMVATRPAWAAGVDPYVFRYLKAREPVPVEMDAQGQTRLFSASDLSAGKRLFEESCINCHVGGATLPDPSVSLSLNTLKGATPPRDNINALVAYLRQPMTYDGSDTTFWCRQVPESWLSLQEVENLAAFVLRAAQTAPGWGTQKFD